MYYIIDANNLAGELRMLKQHEFDQQLIVMLDEFCRVRKKKIVAVFDGYNTLGERFSFGNLLVEYAPKDKFYTSADDKVVELARKYAEKFTEEIVAVTNDRELKERIELVNLEIAKKIKLLSVTDFAALMNQDKQAVELAEEEGLDDGEKNEINDELLNIWR